MLFFLPELISNITEFKSNSNLALLSNQLVLSKMTVQSQSTDGSCSSGYLPIVASHGTNVQRNFHNKIPTKNSLRPNRSYTERRPESQGGDRDYHILSQEEQVILLRLHSGRHRPNNLMATKLRLVLSPLCLCSLENQLPDSGAHPAEMPKLQHAGDNPTASGEPLPTNPSHLCRSSSTALSMNWREQFNLPCKQDCLCDWQIKKLQKKVPCTCLPSSRIQFSHLSSFFQKVINNKRNAARYNVSVKRLHVQWS